MTKKIIFLLSTLMLVNGSLSAEVINVAVASNFSGTLQKLAADFKIETNHDLRISRGSSGKLFAQIIHGAPYDIFLSADEERADLLIKQNKARVENSYVYALGKLVLLSNIEHTDSCKSILNSKQLRRLAIANPNIAPYGAAAKQVLKKLGSWKQLQQRLVMGENIAQTLQFVTTKNAEAGFVARSMVDMGRFDRGDTVENGCIWVVPTDMYSPVKQKMVILEKADANFAAQSFLKYMQSANARKIIKSAGYNVL